MSIFTNAICENEAGLGESIRFFFLPIQLGEQKDKSNGIC